jgi:hypothetical protein
MKTKDYCREGERPREPEHLLDAFEIRAREDARPPKRPVSFECPNHAALVFNMPRA